MLTQDTGRKLANSLVPEGSIYYVHRNAGRAIFVKEGKFFIAQGGLKEPWGQGWTKVRATSIEHARSQAEVLLP